jgi:hypothetical protein
MFFFFLIEINYRKKTLIINYPCILFEHPKGLLTLRLLVDATQTLHLTPVTKLLHSHCPETLSHSLFKLPAVLQSHRKHLQYNFVKKYFQII